jgi:predicted dehydrogenase
MKTVNVGIIGIGFMGVTHIKAYLKIPGARVAAICDPRCLPMDGDLSGITGNLSDGQPLKLDMKQVKGYANHEDLLADPEIDLVDLCVPTRQHHALSLAALRTGKHVICEKPLARTPELCREIVAAAGLGQNQLFQRRRFRRRASGSAHPRYRLRAILLRPATQCFFDRHDAFQRRD